MGDPRDREIETVDPRGAARRPSRDLADLADLLAGDSEHSKRFMGGLVAGALVGAAIAGAAMLRRRATPPGRGGRGQGG